MHVQGTAGRGSPSCSGGANQLSSWRQTTTQLGSPAGPRGRSGPPAQLRPGLRRAWLQGLGQPAASLRRPHRPIERPRSTLYIYAGRAHSLSSSLAPAAEPLSKHFATCPSSPTLLPVLPLSLSPPAPSRSPQPPPSSKLLS